MEKKQVWLKPMLLGGLCAVGVVLSLVLLMNLFLNGIVWGGRVDYYSFQLTTDRCAYEFGSAALAVTVELICVFLLGAAIGLSTLPFAETWTGLLGLSVLHFFVTGGLAMLVGWSYCWLSLSWQVFLVTYLVIYLLIWLARWCVWYAELRQMRKALHLEGKEDTAVKTKRIMRTVSLIMFVIAVIFVLIALSCPTCGSVFYIGSFRVGADIWRAFYKFYAAVMVLLFAASFVIPKK